MADLEGVKVAKNYHLDAPFANQEGFYVKGANALDWGMKKHMSNISDFSAKVGNEKRNTSKYEGLTLKTI